jgi:serpin B
MRSSPPARAGVVAALIACLVMPAACGSNEVVQSAPSGPSTTVAGSSDPGVVLTRSGEPGPLPTNDVLTAAARGEQAFALALYGQVAGAKGNLAIAPSSIATVLGMVAAGAKGATERQLVDALRVPLPAAQLHAAIGGLVRTLAARSGDGVTLSEVDQAWVQQHLHLLTGFTSTLTRDYAAPLASIDFRNTELAAATINRWVSEKTNGKITKLVTPDQLEAAELVLTDAVYLDAKWKNAFDPKRTTNDPFHLGDSSTVSVPTMHQTEHLDTATGAGWTAVAIPYRGDALELDVIVPDDLARFEQQLDPAALTGILASMQLRDVDLALPKFEFRARFDNLKDPLGALGARDAFDPDRADFSGMTGGHDLFLSTVVHEAFVHVDEQGTVAAGATGGIMEPTSAEVVVPVHVDKPFLFVVRDKATGAIVFLGRVTDPRPH